jgi:hypothetical protein
MRTLSTRAIALAVALAGPSCSSSTPGGPSPGTPPPTAAITARALASVPARLCPRCGNLAGELEAVVDLVVDESAGVGGQVTGVNVLFANATTTIEGPGVFDATVLLQFGAPTLRINPRGSLTLPLIGVHFPGTQRDRLPATLRFSVMFRDDNGHNVTSAEVAILITPP